MTDNKTTHWKKQGQRGVALLMALMVLLLLTALAAALVFVSNTETSVNANYRRQQVLYFASKAGIEEARDRLMASNAATLMQPTCAPASACLPATPVVPSAANGAVFYILAGSTPATIAPWTLSTAGAPNPYMEDELCHDGYSLPGQATDSAAATNVNAAPYIKAFLALRRSRRWYFSMLPLSFSESGRELRRGFDC